MVDQRQQRPPEDPAGIHGRTPIAWLSNPVDSRVPVQRYREAEQGPWPALWPGADDPPASDHV